MSFGANPATTTQGALATDQLPLPSVATPGTANGDLTALEGGPISTDANNNKTAPVSVYVKDGSDIAQGTSTDAANANSVVGQLKQIKANTASVVVSTLPALASGTNVIGHVIADSGSTTAVTSLPALPSGTNVIGHVIADSGSTTAATQSGTWNVTNVSGTVSLPTGASTSAKQPALGTAGTASSDVLSVQGIASMTPLKTDGSGVTQPVSGTVSISANSAVNVAQVNGVATTTGNGVSGTGVQRVTLASDSTGQVALATGANTIGALSANQTVNIAQIGGVSTQMMTGDGIAEANIPLVGIGLFNNSGNVVDRLRDAGSSGDQVTIGIVCAQQMLFNGGSCDRLRTPQVFISIAAVSITAGTPVAVWTPTGGRKFHLMGWNLSLSVSGSIIFKDGSTEIWRTSKNPADTGQTSPGNFGNGYASGTSNQALNFDVTATGTVTGFVFGTAEF